MKKTFCIGDICVGDDKRALVIPEIGINHEGSLLVAKEMVSAAYRAGARLIKHQTHVVEDEMCQVAKQVIPGNSSDSIYDIMARCALSEEDEKELKEYTESLGMEFLSTPFSRAAAERLERMGVKAYKIGSGELNNYPLVEHIAEYGKPMIVSTGMNDIKSVAKAVNIMEKYGVPYALMHTTNLYPTKPEWVRLGAMQEMMREFPDVPIGLSDHTLNNNACIAALALGADLVERHFTDEMARKRHVLAAFLAKKKDGQSLGEFLNEEIFAGNKGVKMDPMAEDVEGFEKFMEKYMKNLPAEKAAVEAL